MKPSLALLLRPGISALFAGLVFFSLAAARAVAADDELGTLAWELTVPAGLSKDDVKSTLVNALTRREWGVKSQDGERVVGYLKHRSNEATVTFVYSDAKVTAYCVGWQIDKRTGAREKPEQPKGWLNNLKGDITKAFNRLGTTK